MPDPLPFPVLSVPVLPVPMIIAILLAGFLLQRLSRGGTHATLLTMIAVCAAQSALIALVQYYGLATLRPLQPLLAMAIPPVVWLAFDRASGMGTATPSPLHAAGPLFALASLILQPALLDLMIPLAFAGYGLAMLARLLRGEDSLPHSRLDSAAGSLVAWRIVALSLIGSAFCDVLIAYGLATGRMGLWVWLPSVVSSLSLLSLGALALTTAMESRREQVAEDPDPDPAEAERDRAILLRLDALVAAQKPYLDPDLTLARLAKRLVLPAKQLSAAINRGRGENVSRYINRLRIAEACRLLETGTPVTSVMLDAGFNTKSNFNREFLRVTGQSPTQWLAARRGEASAT